MHFINDSIFPRSQKNDLQIPEKFFSTASASPSIVPLPTASSSTDDNHGSDQPPPALALLKNLGDGGYAEVRQFALEKRRTRQQSTVSHGRVDDT